MRKTIYSLLLTLTISAAATAQRTETTLTDGWKFQRGDAKGAQSAQFDDRKWQHGHLVVFHIVISTRMGIGIKKRQITFICTRYFRHILHITLVEMYLKPCIKRAYKKPSVQFTSIRSYPPDNTVLLLCVYKGGDVQDIEVSLH